MKPRRLQSATIFSMVTRSWASVAIGLEARRWPRLTRLRETPQTAQVFGRAAARELPLIALFRPRFEPDSGGTLASTPVDCRGARDDRHGTSRNKPRGRVADLALHGVSLLADLDSPRPPQGEQA